MAKKHGTYEQWKELGELTKHIRGEILALLDKAQKLRMTVKDTRYAWKVYHDFDRFRSEAEEAMFKDIGEHGGANIKVFYGNDEDDENKTSSR
ncbi:MAG: hypothetical protein Q8O55_08955 [Dehalococcoidales bacterium]|nr:hypothetical protein [Dehalococcoidales bacterium]